MFGLDTGYTLLLIACLIAACSFEFINGFHDTANAVATVIYTHTLKPTWAVIWSGLWNFIGVNVGGIAVAIGIINLLPTEILIDQNLAHNISMIMALILTSIIWNLSTWYLGIPCSSSHTLIGSIFGVGLAFLLMPGAHNVALNWHKAGEVGLSLLISPLLGFGLAFLLLLLMKAIIRNKQIFKEPPAKKAPPFWIRSILVLTCTSVSYAHGSNDGQKGVGLIMLILIGFSPVFFAIDRHQQPETLLHSTKMIEWTLNKINLSKFPAKDQLAFTSIHKNIDTVKTLLTGVKSFDQLSKQNHYCLRRNIIIVSKQAESFLGNNPNASNLNLTKAQLMVLRTNLREFRAKTEYAPRWVILMVSLSLGLGTMIGWKRIVVTIGERIGKTHLTYAQGATSEIIAATTIAASTMFGLPVSTTHVLSSGVAGTMVADGGKRNLHIQTVESILIAWVITLPVTIILSGTLFLFLRWLIH